MSPMPEGVTTAEVLVRYRGELLDGGMPIHLVDDLVRDAAHQLVDRAGLGVKHLSSDPSVPQPSDPEPSDPEPRPMARSVLDQLRTQLDYPLDELEDEAP